MKHRISRATDRILGAVILIAVSAGLACAYEVAGDWSYTDVNHNGSWDPGELQKWQYKVSCSSNEDPPTIFGVYVGSYVTEDVLAKPSVIDGDTGQPWTGNWRFEVVDRTEEHYSSLVRFTALDSPFPRAAVFSFYDNPDDKIQLWNVTGPFDDDIAWGDKINKETTTAIWYKDLLLYQRTGDPIPITPEPSTALLCLLGLGLLSQMHRKGKKER